MTDLDLGVIYSIKQFKDGENCKDRIKNFLREYEETPQEHKYDDRELFFVLVEVMKDYFETADNPRLDLYNFFDSLHLNNPFKWNTVSQQELVRNRVIEAIIGMFEMARVKCMDSEGHQQYVNGFRKMRMAYNPTNSSNSSESTSNS